MQHLSIINHSQAVKGGSRGGVSLVEVLVAIAIIAVILSITIPAVQNVRESSRRIQCSNQVRQITLAAQNYESGFGRFPTRRFFNEIRDYLEIASLTKDVPLYACPSDNQASGNVSQCRQSYSVNAGLGTRDPQHVGFVSEQVSRYTKAAEITDGLSNTVMVGERLSFPSYSPNTIAWNERPGDWKRTYVWFSTPVATPEQFFVECSLHSVRPINTWYVSTNHHHLMPPNSKSCMYSDTSGSAGVIAPQLGLMVASLHPGGAHVSFCDGSVKFVSDQMAIEVWRSLGTRAGGDSF